MTGLEMPKLYTGQDNSSDLIVVGYDWWTNNDRSWNMACIFK